MTAFARPQSLQVHCSAHKRSLAPRAATWRAVPAVPDACVSLAVSQATVEAHARSPPGLRRYSPRAPDPATGVAQGGGGLPEVLASEAEVFGTVWNSLIRVDERIANGVSPDDREEIGGGSCRDR